MHSLAGALEPGDGLLTRPPFAAPAPRREPRPAWSGGGTGTVRPGEISRAHCGVLFLDEFPLFRADVIDALRQPLESGEISRRPRRGVPSCSRPARMVVLAANPCPCGDFHPTRASSRCICRETQRRDYRRKVTGPITDRIDITRHLAARAPTAERDPLAVRESTAEVRARVEAAGPGRHERYAGRAVAAQRPGARAGAARALAADDGGRPGCVDDQLWTGTADPPRREPASTGSPGPSPTCAGVDRPGVTEAEVALRLRTGEPLLAALDGGPDERPAIDERLARLALSRLGEPGDLRIAAPGRRRSGPSSSTPGCSPTGTRTACGPTSARRLADMRSRARPRAGRAARHPLRRARRRRSGPRRSTTSTRCEPLQELGGVPLGLWVRGPLRLDALPAPVAVVGARSATTYGTDVAAELAAGLARAGPAVVSGAAFGIDQAAHRGALAGDGPTVAVLACGVDRAYPAAHQQLLDHLAEPRRRSCPSSRRAARRRGPGSSPATGSSPRSCRGTVVVEAAVRSGALNTASWTTAAQPAADGRARTGHERDRRRGCTS